MTVIDTNGDDRIIPFGSPTYAHRWQKVYMAGITREEMDEFEDWLSNSVYTRMAPGGEIWSDGDLLVRF